MRTAVRVAPLLVAIAIGNGALAQQPRNTQPPRQIIRVDPAYTDAARRARVEGTVTLSVAIEADGTVADVRVVRPLHPELDEAAMAAVRQWRYEPATVNGKPVRVTATISLGFALSVMPPALTWPTGFAPPSGVNATEATWPESVATASGLEFRVFYPPDWTVRKDSASRMEVLRVQNAGATRQCRISYPRPAPVEIDSPLPVARLQQLADTVQKSTALGRAGISETRGIGQARRADGTLWLWYEMQVPPGEVLTGSAAQTSAQMYENARVWVFTFTVGKQAVTIGCHALVRRGASDVQKETELKDAASRLGSIISRLSVYAAP
jgi:TonB family protein